MRRLLVIALLMLVAGCTMLVATPVVEVKDVSLVGLDSKGVEVELYLAVTNPNLYDLRLKGFSYDLKVMALPLAKGGGRESFEFKGGTTTDLRLPVRVTFSNLYEIVKRIPDPDNLPYRLDAGLELESPMGSYTLPLVHNGIFRIPDRYRPFLYLKRLSETFSQ